MLTLENVNVFYGAIHALRSVSLTVNKGEVVTYQTQTAPRVSFDLVPLPGGAAGGITVRF